MNFTRNWPTKRGYYWIEAHWANEHVSHEIVSLSDYTGDESQLVVEFHGSNGGIGEKFYRESEVPFLFGDMVEFPQI